MNQIRNDPGRVSRRVVVAGMAGLTLTGPLRAETSSPIAHDALANNALAQAFQEPPTTFLPDVSVMGLSGQTPISDVVKGRTVLMPIWAEWCAPCLAEIPDFARLQQKFGNDKFAIIPVLSSPMKQVNPPLMKQFLQILHAGIFEPYIENRLGSKLAATMGRQSRGYALPCNILIKPDGRVAAREMGLKSDHEDSGTDSPKTGEQLIARAEAGDNLSLWGKPVGEEFAQAMANGFLA